MKPIITLLTDFGRHDGYVGAMHGVALNICPKATIVDISHTVPPQDIQTAAFILYQIFTYYPTQTIHCVVVDPGVGSERQAIAVQTKHGTFVSPNNGVLSLVLQATPILAAIELTNSAYHLPKVSNTFHGRDIFTPVAAHLADGVPLRELGEPITELLSIEWPRLMADDQCRVIHVDHFGNLVLDVQANDIENFDTVSFTIGGETIVGLDQTFADVDIGDFVAYVGSTHNHVEIAIRNGHAAHALRVQPGDTIFVTK